MPEKYTKYSNNTPVAKNIIFLCVRRFLNGVIPWSGAYLGGGLWRPGPPGSSKGRQKEKGKRTKEREKERKKRERRKKKDKKKERKVNQHDERGAISFKLKQGLQGRKVQGRQIDASYLTGGGGGQHSSTLLQGAKTNDSLGPPGGRPPGYAPEQSLTREDVRSNRTKRAFACQ